MRFFNEFGENSLTQNTNVRFGEWIREAWNLLTAQWQTWAVITFIYMIPIGVIYGYMEYFSYKIQQPLTGDNWIKMLTENFVQSITISLITQFLITFVEAFFIGGIFNAAFKQLNGEEISSSDIFSGTEFYVNILVASLVISMLEFAGAFLCFFPSLIVRGLFFLTIPLIVRKNFSPLEALKESYNATKGDWFMYTLFVIVVALLSVLGIFACIIGILFTLPLLFLTTAVAYRDCFEPELKPMSRVDELYSKYCRNCGASIPVNASACDKCGTSQV